MENMKCQIKNHNGKEIHTICLDMSCQNKKLCCLTCIKEFHSTHVNKLVDVDEMNAFLKQVSSKQVQNPQTCSYGQIQMIQGLEGLITLIDILKKAIMEKIQKIKQQKNSQQEIEYWNQVLEGIIQYVEIDNSQIKFSTSKQGQLNKMEEKEIQIIQQSEQSLQFIINQITQPQIKNDNQVQIQIKTPYQMKYQIPTETEMLTQIINIGQLCFTENRKHEDIVLLDQSTIKKINYNSQAMAFANEGFDPKNQSYAFAFKIQKCDCYIQIGVGNEEGRIAPSYLFDNSNLRHGLYMLRNDGSTLHHTDESLNQKERGMRFTTGDKIQIKYDHVTKVLEFRKSSDQKTVVTMPITDMTKKLYPCAELYFIFEQVQLVEY